MPFDPNLDVALWKEEIDFPERNTKIAVSVMQYNEGEKKLQISRENKRGEEYTFAKLGRMTKEESEKVLPLMQKALENM